MSTDFLEKIDKEIRRRARHERFHTMGGQMKFGLDVMAVGATLVIVSPCITVVFGDSRKRWKILSGAIGSGLALTAYGFWTISRPILHEYVDEEVVKK